MVDVYFFFSLFFFLGGFWVGWRNCAFVCIALDTVFLGGRETALLGGEGLWYRKHM